VVYRGVGRLTANHDLEAKGLFVSDTTISIPIHLIGVPVREGGALIGAQSAEIVVYVRRIDTAGINGIDNPDAGTVAMHHATPLWTPGVPVLTSLGLEDQSGWRVRHVDPDPLLPAVIPEQLAVAATITRPCSHVDTPPVTRLAGTSSRVTCTRNQNFRTRQTAGPVRRKASSTHDGYHDV
jgi:hypothetical protein